jgi:N-acetylglucosamine kinase-like BadF-type ATPase
MGASNYDNDGMEKAKDSIEEAVQAARWQEVLSDSPSDSVFPGIAGVVSDKDRV